MKIEQHTVSINEEEAMILGEALEHSLENRMKVYIKNNRNFDRFKESEDETLSLLHDFFEVGNRLCTVDSGDVWKTTDFTDAWEWAEAMFNQLKNE